MKVLDWRADEKALTEALAIKLRKEPLYSVIESAEFPIYVGSGYIHSLMEGTQARDLDLVLCPNRIGEVKSFFRKLETTCEMVKETTSLGGDRYYIDGSGVKYYDIWDVSESNVFKGQPVGKKSIEELLYTFPFTYDQLVMPVRSNWKSPMIVGPRTLADLKDKVVRFSARLCEVAKINEVECLPYLSVSNIVRSLSQVLKGWTLHEDVYKVMKEGRIVKERDLLEKAVSRGLIDDQVVAILRMYTNVRVGKSPL